MRFEPVLVGFTQSARIGRRQLSAFGKIRTTWVRRLISSFSRSRHVGALQISSQLLARQSGEAERLFDVFLDPSSQPRGYLVCHLPIQAPRRDPADPTGRLFSRPEGRLQPAQLLQAVVVHPQVKPVGRLCAARSRASSLRSARNSVDRPPPAAPRGSTPSARHDRRQPRTRRRRARARASRGGSRANSTGSAVGQFHAERLAAAVPIDADGHQHGMAGDHAGLAHLLVALIQDQVERLAQPARGELPGFRRVAC